MNKVNIDNTLIALGIPPAAAQIVKTLLSSAPNTHSHTTLHESLNLSKSAVTGGLHYLEALGAIAYQRDASGRRQMITFHVYSLIKYTQRRMIYFRQFANELQQCAADQNDVTYAEEIRNVAELCDELDSAVNNVIDKGVGHSGGI